MCRALRIFVTCYLASAVLLAGQTQRPKRPEPQTKDTVEAPAPPSKPIDPDYEALRSFLRQRQAAAKARNAQPGFADQVLIGAGNLGDLACVKALKLKHL